MCFASIRRGVTGWIKGQELAGSACLSRIAGIVVGKVGSRVNEKVDNTEKRCCFARMDVHRATADGSCGKASIRSPAVHEEFGWSGAIRAMRTMLPIRQTGHRRELSATAESTARIWSTDGRRLSAGILSSSRQRARFRFFVRPANRP